MYTHNILPVVKLNRLRDIKQNNVLRSTDARFNSQVLPEYGRRNVSPSVRLPVRPSADHALGLAKFNLLGSNLDHFGLFEPYFDYFWHYYASIEPFLVILSPILALF